MVNEEDKISTIVLFPCPGSPVNPLNHIYTVDEFYESGKQVSAIDFVTLREAQEKYHPQRLEVRVSESHGSCLDCRVYRMNKPREEVIRVFYPNYRGD